MFAGKKSAQIREILISESAWEEMTCLFAPSLEKEFARGSTLKTITKEEFSKFQIPIPPLEVQNRIVALLDKFDRLTHSIEEGLPRELELRQKQYEYYRELLFSFPKLEAASN